MVAVSMPEARRRTLGADLQAQDMVDTERVEAGFPRMLRVGEAARILHVHPNTLRKWSSYGLIPSYRIGRRRDRRFFLKDLARYLESDGSGSELNGLRQEWR